MELQSHGFLTHTGGCSGMGHGGLLMCMDHDAGVADTKQSFDYVDGGFVYCYPFGDINENAESIVRDGGARLAFTTAGGRITQNMDPLALPRVRVTGGNGLSAFAASIS
jgi:predicted enzyme related to lactoylglutathione lyase